MLKLVLGGHAQGKLKTSLSEAFPNEPMTEEAVAKLLASDDLLYMDERNWEIGIEGRKLLVINHLHLIAKAFIDRALADAKSGQTDLENRLTEELLAWVRHLAADSEDTIVITDEIGNGIIPVEQNARLLREVLGRVLIELAKQADSVERVVCQIPQKIK